MPTISLSELHNIESSYFHESQEERANNCSRMSQLVKMELEDENIPVQPYVVRISNNTGTDTHRVLEVDTKYIDGLHETGNVFLDPSIHQFCKDNYESELVQLYLPDSEIPPLNEMGILSESGDPFQSLERIAKK